MSSDKCSNKKLIGVFIGQPSFLQKMASLSIIKSIHAVKHFTTDAFVLTEKSLFLSTSQWLDSEKIKMFVNKLYRLTYSIGAFYRHSCISHVLNQFLKIKNSFVSFLSIAYEIKVSMQCCACMQTQILIVCNYNHKQLGKINICFLLIDEHINFNNTLLYIVLTSKTILFIEIQQKC